MATKTIFYDVTTLLQNPIRDGIRRVVFNWIFEIADINPKDTGYKVIPIYFSNWNYEIASDFLGQIYPGIPTPSLYSSEISPKPGDVLIVPAYDVFVPGFELNLKEFLGVCKIVSVVYDILPISNPEWFPGMVDKNHFIPALKKSILLSDLIIVNTKHVKTKLEDQINLYFGRNSIPIVSVVPLSGSLRHFLIEIDSKNKSSIKQEIHKSDRIRLLAVGTLEPRKGYLDILKSFQEARRINSKLHLTLIGRLGWNTEPILEEIERTRSLYKDSFTWLSNASDSELSQFYDSADVVICASYEEGFGLPLAEAMSRGKISLAREISVFREVSQGQAVYFGEDSDFENLGQALDNIEIVLKTGVSRISEFNPISPLDSALKLISTLKNYLD